MGTGSVSAPSSNAPVGGAANGALFDITSVRLLTARQYRRLCQTLLVRSTLICLSERPREQLLSAVSLAWRALDHLSLLRRSL